MSWKPTVQTFGDPKYYTNNLAFATQDEAEISARGLASRWMLVENWSTEESDQPVNYEIVDGQLRSLGTFYSSDQNKEAA